MGCGTSISILERSSEPIKTTSRTRTNASLHRVSSMRMADKDSSSEKRPVSQKEDVVEEMIEEYKDFKRCSSKYSESPSSKDKQLNETILHPQVKFVDSNPTREERLANGTVTYNTKLKQPTVLETLYYMSQILDMDVQLYVYSRGGDEWRVSSSSLLQTTAADSSISKEPAVSSPTSPVPSGCGDSSSPSLSCPAPQSPRSSSTSGAPDVVIGGSGWKWKRCSEQRCFPSYLERFLKQGPDLLSDERANKVLELVSTFIYPWKRKDEWDEGPTTILALPYPSCTVYVLSFSLRMHTYGCLYLLDRQHVWTGQPWTTEHRNTLETCIQSFTQVYEYDASSSFRPTRTLRYQDHTP